MSKCKHDGPDTAYCDDCWLEADGRWTSPLMARIRGRMEYLGGTISKSSIDLLNDTEEAIRATAVAAERERIRMHFQNRADKGHSWARIALLNLNTPSRENVTEGREGENG